MMTFSSVSESKSTQGMALDSMCNRSPPGLCELLEDPTLHSQGSYKNEFQMKCILNENDKFGA